MYISGVARGPPSTVWKKIKGFFVDYFPSALRYFYSEPPCNRFFHDGWPTFTCIPVRKHPKIVSDIPKKNIENRTGTLNGVPFFHNPITKKFSLSRKKDINQPYIIATSPSSPPLSILDLTFNKCTKALTSRSSFFRPLQVVYPSQVWGMGVGYLGWRVDTEKSYQGSTVKKYMDVPKTNMPEASNGSCKARNVIFWWSGKVFWELGWFWQSLSWKNEDERDEVVGGRNIFTHHKKVFSRECQVVRNLPKPQAYGVCLKLGNHIKKKTMWVVNKDMGWHGIFMTKSWYIYIYVCIYIYLYMWDMHCALQILFGDGHFARATTLC